ncbi:MAG: hypothetical protein ABIF11_02185 [Nitrospirota bacterium]
MDKTTAKAIKRLGNHFPLIGTLFRANGARSLVGTEEPSAVLPLIQTLNDKSQKVQELARLAINNLQGKAKNHLCLLWAEKRDKVLEAIITKCEYVASEPTILTALTTFLNGKKLGIPLSQEILAGCLTDADRRIVKGAVDSLIEGKGDEGYNVLWDFSLDHPDSIVPEVVKERGWYPKEPAERALFYFLANDFVAYHDIDFEQSYLRVWYETGRQVLKTSIASRIRKSGDTRLLAIFRTKRGGSKERHSHDEVELQIGIFLKVNNYPELFRLLKQATWTQGVQIITKLKSAGWENPDTHGRKLQERLEALTSDRETTTKLPDSYALGIYQDFRPMLLGSEVLPEDEATLFAWVDDRTNFRQRSAAIILLAEKGHAKTDVPNKASGNYTPPAPSQEGIIKMSDVANKASGDPYWQVRMASAVTEMLKPGTLSPANKTLLENDHVYWVQTILKMPQSGRLVELTPKGLEELSKAGNRSNPKQKPPDAENFFNLIKGFLSSAEREYLRTLSEFWATDIEHSDDVSYEAGERDVEIEE